MAPPKHTELERMVPNIADASESRLHEKSWYVRWSGSQDDFLAAANQPIPLERIRGMESLYAIGSLEQRTGEVSVFDSVPFVSEVWRADQTIDPKRRYQAEFLLYAIVEHWHRTAIWKSVASERDLEAALLPRAVVEGINIEEPFPFLLYGHAAYAAGRFCCDAAHTDHARLTQEQQSHFSIQRESIEVIGFYSTHHPGVLTTRDSHLHMHLRTLDNRISGHLESVQWEQGFMVELPARGG